jgi:hypothetical protein
VDTLAAGVLLKSPQRFCESTRTPQYSIMSLRILTRKPLHFSVFVRAVQTEIKSGN